MLLDGSRGSSGRPVALVTGSGRGIGRAIALALGEAGLAVAVQGRTLDGVEETLQLIEAAGGTAVISLGDVTDPGYVSAAVTSITQSLGPVDLLVNNAGVTDPAELHAWEADPERWWRVVETDLRGPMLTCSAVLPEMVRRGRGRIVNMGTLAASRTDPYYSAYGAAKAGLMRLTDSLDAGLAGSGVSVFDVSPGLVRTDMTAAMPVWAAVPHDDWVPVGRVVDLVLRIAQGDADALTGRFLHATDDLDDLMAHAESMSADARKLRIARYGEDDPLPA